MKTRYSLFLLIALFILKVNNVFAQNLILENYLNEEGWYEFSSSDNLDPASVFTTYKDQFGLGDFDDLGLDSVFDEGGEFLPELTPLHYIQYYKNVKVEKTKFIIQVDNTSGTVQRIMSSVVPNLDLDVSNPISEYEALELALELINANEYGWQNDSFETAIKVIKKDEFATWFPTGRLSIANASNSSVDPDEFKFCWQFEILVTDPDVEYMNAYVYPDEGNGWVSGLNGNCMPQLMQAHINFSRFSLQTALSDEFTSGGVDNAKWAVDPIGHSCKWPAGGATWDQSIPSTSTDNIDNRTIADGISTADVLTIKTLKLTSPDPNFTCPFWLTINPNGYLFTSSNLSSQEEFLYGYYELRSKFPMLIYETSQNFWMWGAKCTDRGEPFNSYSEIDIFEHKSKSSVPNSNSRMPTNIHANVGGSSCDNSCPSMDLEYNPDICINLSNEFHTYGVEWSPGKVIFYFDEHALTRPSGAVYGLSAACITPPDEDGLYSVITAVSDLKSMKIEIGQSIGFGATDLPNLGDEINFDLDHFRYYKHNPVISGPSSTCPGHTETYTASIIGGSFISNSYVWSVSNGASIVGSNTGSSCSILMPSSGANSVTITLTATDTGPYYKTFATPRISEETKIVSLYAPGMAPEFVLAPYSNSGPCFFRVVAYNSDYDNLLFSFDQGQTWEDAYLRQTTVFGITEYFWTVDHHFSINSLPITIKCKIENCMGTSPIRTKTFTSYSGGNCNPRISRNNKIALKENKFKSIYSSLSQSLKLDYYLSESSSVTINICNAYGQVIETIVNNTSQHEGDYSFNVGTSKYSSGVYFCNLYLDNNRIETKKFVVLR